MRSARRSRNLDKTEASQNLCAISVLDTAIGLSTEAYEVRRVTSHGSM
jgi:hypothetical protein